MHRAKPIIMGTTGQLHLKVELRSLIKLVFMSCHTLSAIASDACSMASILSLPDELIELLGVATERHVGIKAWCRLTRTCRRLLKLQLPDSHRGVCLSDGTKNEGRSPWQRLSERQLQAHLGEFSVMRVRFYSGVAWMPQRMQAAPWLCLYMPDLGDDWIFDASGSHANLVNSLQEHCQAAATASRELKNFRLLVINPIGHIDRRSSHARCSRNCTHQTSSIEHLPWARSLSSMTDPVSLALYWPRPKVYAI